ncbi:AbrB/MazE/SpoVT family DNA-binding domain-containing protein [Cupriavidus sp. H39]|uniref:AbrB/MazE/SpoVT family DNA-binding domain-containing protein n=1 Tax=Cupriavidus sp. H39 TaxID=3401635 RepID=UPI003D057EC4
MNPFSLVAQERNSRDVLKRASSMYKLVSTFNQVVSMSKSATLTIQKWGNSLAVRIPSNVARAAHFTEGLTVEVALDDDGLTVKPVGQRTLTLAEKLALFDPAKHSGEAMAVSPIGTEAM